MLKELLPSSAKAGALSNMRWMQLLVALVLLAGLVSVVWELLALHSRIPSLLAATSRAPSTDIFTLAAPPLLSSSLTWLELDAAEPRDVPSDELLHLSFLQDACLAQNDTLLPWFYGAPGHTKPDSVLPESEPRLSRELLHRGDPRLVEELAKCPDVDIYLPASARGPQGCATAAGPLKFLQSRLLPRWALDAELFDYSHHRSVSYLQLCPRTPMLFLAAEHALELALSTRWPAQKPVYLLAPGLELSTARPELTRAALALADVVLCSTRQCDDDVKEMLLQELMLEHGDTKQVLLQTLLAEHGGRHVKRTRVLHTSHTSVDASTFARRLLGESALATQDFSAPRFVHSTWNRSSEATQQVLQCWVRHATELPRLDLFVLEPYDVRKKHAGWRSYEAFPGGDKQQKNVLKFSQAVAEAAFFVCPTAGDDCLHMARAAGGVVLTADAQPMNELLAPTQALFFPTQQQSRSPLVAPVVNTNSDDMCDAVVKVAKEQNEAARQAMGALARRQFHEDTKLFALRMLQLRAYASRAKSGARDLLAAAVAHTLALRPRVPVAFLACHFQGVASSPTTAVAAALRACHPSSPNFVCAVEQGFHDLAAVTSTSSENALSLSRPTTASRSGTSPPRQIVAAASAVVAEATFARLLLQLSVDFPQTLQTRLVDALLSGGGAATAKEGVETPGVGLTRFQRGVQACLLLEELLDAAAALTQALDHSQEHAGSEDRPTLITALRAAATSQFPRDAAAVLLPLLHESAAAETVGTGDDVQELLFDLVFRA